VPDQRNENGGCRRHRRRTASQRNRLRANQALRRGAAVYAVERLRGAQSGNHSDAQRRGTARPISQAAPAFCQNGAADRFFVILLHQFAIWAGFAVVQPVVAEWVATQPAIDTGLEAKQFEQRAVHGAAVDRVV
jgi:hypothetical protein